MQYVVGMPRVFRFGRINGDAPLLIGKALQSKAVPQRPHKQPSSEQRLEPQFMCVFDPCASMDDIGDDRRPLSVAQQAGCILAKNAHARHDVDFDFDAICGGRPCKLAVRCKNWVMRLSTLRYTSSSVAECTSYRWTRRFANISIERATSHPQGYHGALIRLRRLETYWIERKVVGKPWEACGVTLVPILPGDGIHEADERS
jgi:hypothetical protein